MSENGWPREFDALKATTALPSMIFVVCLMTERPHLNKVRCNSRWPCRLVARTSRAHCAMRRYIFAAGAAERATEARKEADKLAVEAWNKRMLGFQGAAQPSPALGDALNAGFRYLEVKCLGCNTHRTVALDIRAATEGNAGP
jgi:hypothetical protein